MTDGSWKNFYKIIKYLAIVEKSLITTFDTFFCRCKKSKKKKNLKSKNRSDPREKSFLDTSV